ncbi:MAG: hydantoinase/oxoprolinase family protein [Bacillota bacterium]
MPNLALGIDTGGTYTDGVIFNTNTREIISKTKVLTTRHNLNLAIENCLANLLDKSSNEINHDMIKMVSLSTTLATNAIVEGQGAEVGLITIGSEINDKLPTPYYCNLEGGCNIKGKVQKELDLKQARIEIDRLTKKVDAFAVSGYLSIRNPIQEIKLKRLINDITGYPVVCAHQLSSELGFKERTVTAVFNARLLPLITNLIKAVKLSLKQRDIKAPLMVVRGDGSLISEEVAREKPVETSLSGPAASIIGAKTLTDIKDGIVVDMGGTTTDIAVLKDGKPRLTEKGAKVGGWLTRVKAADITTIGIGGDSFIQVSKDKVLSIGPQKVFPLSWIVKKHGHLHHELSEIKDSKYFPLSSQPTTILTYVKEPENLKLTETEEKILKLIKDKPHSLYHVAKKLNKPADILPWDHLVKVGVIHRASLTPTDLLHIKGNYKQWDVDAANLGIKIMADRFDSKVDEFIAQVFKEIYYQIGSVITEVLINEEGNEVSLESRDSKYFLSKMITKNDHNKKEKITFNLKCNIPLIAVGAPVEAYFPQIAERLNTELILPEYAEVANAVGTVGGKVIEKVVVLVKPGQGGGFLVHTPNERKFFKDFKEAQDFGKEIGKEIAVSQAKSSGASNIETHVKKHDKYSDFYGEGKQTKDEDKLFIESRIEVTAVGKPW